MKKNYETLMIKIVIHCVEDILTASTPFPTDENELPFVPFS